MVKRILSILRGKVNAEGYLSIIASLALIDYDNSNNIESILKSGDNTVESFLAKLSQIVEKLDVELTWFMSDSTKSIRQIESTTLTKILFDSLELFDKKEPDEVLTEAIEIIPEHLGKEFGIHTTPTDVNNLALSILDVKSDESYLEPTAGYGNALNRLLMKNPEQVVFAQDINGFASDITKIRSILLDASNTTVKTSDVLVSPQYIKGDKLQKFDVVYSDAPFSAVADSDEIYECDPYNRYIYGKAPKSRADWAFISNGISSLNERGRALFIVAQGALFRGGKEAAIRKNIIELDLIESVISLPSNLLYNTSIPIAMIVINKNKLTDTENLIRMVDAEDIYSEKKRIKYLSQEDIKQILILLKPETQAQNVALINKDELDNYNLNIKRYISTDQVIKDRELGEVIVKADKIDKLDTFKLKEKSEIIRGVNLTKTTDNNQYKVIKISDIDDSGHIDFENLSVSNFSDNTKVENYMIQKGDLLISIRGATIKTAVIRENIEDVLVSQNLALIRVNKEINVEWLYFYLNSPIGLFEIEEKLKGETVQSLSPASIKEIKIPLMSYEIQTEIVKKYLVEKKHIENQIEQLKNNITIEKKSALKKMGLENTFQMLSTNLD